MLEETVFPAYFLPCAAGRVFARPLALRFDPTTSVFGADAVGLLFLADGYPPWLSSSVFIAAFNMSAPLYWTPVPANQPFSGRVLLSICRLVACVSPRLPSARVPAPYLVYQRPSKRCTGLTASGCPHHASSELLPPDQCSISLDHCGDSRRSGFHQNGVPPADPSLEPID